MTRQRDIGRVLDAWLEPGPREAPDRVLAVLADRIEHVPQRRYPRAQERSHAMTSTIKLAAAAAILLSIGIAAGTALGPVRTEVLQPTPSPEPTLSVIPESLQGPWLADYRLIEGLDNANAFGVAFELTPIMFQMRNGSDGRLVSSARIEPDGSLRLETVLADRGCGIGDVGTYRWSISDLGPVTLTLEPLADPCQLRASVLTGTWISEQCPHEYGGTCRGKLAAGSHQSTMFEPRAARKTPAKWRFGGLTYIVPEGWANDSDWQPSHRLVPIEAFQRAVEDPDLWTDQISVYVRPVALMAESSCTGTMDPEVGRSAEALVRFVVDHPGLTVSEPVAVAVGGHSGTQLDIDLAPDWTTTCAEWPDVRAFVPLFGEGDMVNANGTIGGYWWGPGARGPSGDPMRLIIVDLGDEDVAIVLIDSEVSSDLPEFLRSAMPIVQSMRFTP